MGTHPPTTSPPRAPPTRATTPPGDWTRSQPTLHDEGPETDGVLFCDQTKMLRTC